MDGERFDALTRRVGAGLSRRSVLKGLLGMSGAAAATTLVGGRSEAAWSTLVCLPDGADGYIQRLVPTAAVPLYVSRYGALVAENGVCPCVPRSVEEACANGPCGGSADRGCGLTATCGLGVCAAGSCMQRVSDGSYLCGSGIFCNDEFFIPCEFCGSAGVCDPSIGYCVTCLSDGRCGPGGACVRVSDDTGCIGGVACTTLV